MNIENFRVYLKAFEPDDYKTTIKWHNDNEIWNMVGSTKYFVSIGYEKKGLEMLFGKMFRLDWVYVLKKQMN